MQQPHVGAIGLPIEITVVNDLDAELVLTGATTKKIRIKVPGAETIEKEAELVGTSVLRYVTVEDDLPVPGWYQVQGRVVTPGWADHTATGSFEVLRPL